MKNHEQAMSVRETNPLAKAEKTIARGKRRLVEIGLALGEIRDLRLYRRDYGTFDEYCRAKLGCGRRRAYRLIKAAANGKCHQLVTSEQKTQVN
jgi:hypothetical protein